MKIKHIFYSLQETKNIVIMQFVQRVDVNHFYTLIYQKIALNSSKRHVSLVHFMWQILKVKFVIKHKNIFINFWRDLSQNWVEKLNFYDKFWRTIKQHNNEITTL